MASVLFIASADLGETVLALGALDYAMTRMRADSVTVVCDPAAESLFRALPGLSDIYPWRSEQGFGPWISMAWKIARRPFDLALDFRGSPAGYAVQAKRRIVRSTPQMLRHLSEDYSDAVGAEQTLAPKLWLDDAVRDVAAAAAPGGGPLLVIAPGGVVSGKRWPPERFAAVARRLASGPLGGARVVLLGAAARDVEVTRTIASSLDADEVPALDLGSRLDLLAAAALLEQATLCVGNDNALTHIAAAVGAPTLTLFGPTDERVRAPYGPRTRTLRGRPLEDIAARPALDERAAMEDVSVDAVEAAALDLLHAGGLR